MATRDPEIREDISGVPRMSADRETSVERRSPSSSDRRSSSGGGLLTTLAFLVIIMLAGATYFLWVEYQAMQQTAAVAETRIANLEAQLVSAGDEMSQSDAAVRVQLNSLDKEVRRLEQNRKKDKDMLAQHDKSVKNLVTRTTQSNGKQKAINAQMTALSAELDDIVETLASANFSEDRKKLQQALLRLQQADDEVGVLGKRVSDTEEWLNAIDAFRQQVNARLNSIENPVQQTPQLQ